MEYVVVDARGLPVGAGEEAVIFPPLGWHRYRHRHQHLHLHYHHHHDF